MKILVADDNETNRLVARTILEDAGYVVAEARDGAAALNAARGELYDLILMDVSMPELDGLSAARAIRRLPGRHAAVPLLALTAHAMPGDRERCIAAGMDDHIAKPINRATLLTAIGRWIAARPKPVNMAGNPGATDPLDAAVLARLEADVGRMLLPSLIGSFVADARTHSLRIARALADADLPRIAVEATALADAAATYGAQHLHHCPDQLATAARSGDLARTQALAASITPLTDDAVEALMSRYAG